MKKVTSRSGIYIIFFICVLTYTSNCYAVDADGVGQESINISNTEGMLGQPDLFVDNNGNPHVVWVDNETGTYHIYYLKWQKN